MPLPIGDLRATFGDIDVYLFDQLLKGRIAPGMRLLDAGAGAGRNLFYLLGQGLEVHAVDSDPGAVAALQRLAAERAPQASADHFRAAELDALDFPDASFEVVLAIASLHFARSASHFDAMVSELWRVLAPGGMLFARLASRTSMEAEVLQLGNGRFRLPDGSQRYLVDESMLHRRTTTLGGELLEPLRTVRVEGQRAMATWVLRKLRRV